MLCLVMAATHSGGLTAGEAIISKKSRNSPPVREHDPGHNALKECPSVEKRGSGKMEPPPRRPGRVPLGPPLGDPSPLSWSARPVVRCWLGAGHPRALSRQKSARADWISSPCSLVWFPPRGSIVPTGMSAVRRETRPSRVLTAPRRHDCCMGRGFDPWNWRGAVMLGRAWPPVPLTLD